METPTILVSTWSDGVFALVGDVRDHELAGRPVRGLSSDGRGAALAIVDGHSLQRRTANGEWRTLASAEAELACCVATGAAIYIGTEDAQILRLDAGGELARLSGFEAVAGRERWYAGQALIDGRLLGPPLGVRSITATLDGGVLLANVHVGGIPRSTDGGATWHPTLAIESDVHEVRAHPTRPELVMAAAAVGLCISHDSGASWAIESEGLHAPHCTAVGFAENDVLVAASVDQFSVSGAVYRRPIDAERALLVVGAGLPEWLEGIADTGCISSHGPTLAIADGNGNVYVSETGGRDWSRRASGLPHPSGVLVLGA